MNGRRAPVLGTRRLVRTPGDEDVDDDRNNSARIALSLLKSHHDILMDIRWVAVVGPWPVVGHSTLNTDRRNSSMGRSATGTFRGQRWCGGK